MPNETMYAIPQSLAQGLLNYLVQRPYAEVAPAVEALKALQPIQPATPDLDAEAPTE